MCVYMYSVGLHFRVHPIVPMEIAEAGLNHNTSLTSKQIALAIPEEF